MKATTWSRESHGLFDYGSEKVSLNNLKATTSAKIVRIQNDIHLATDPSNEKSLSPHSETLAYLRQQENTFVVTKEMNLGSQNETITNENLWLVAKSLTNENGNTGIPLKQFDIIKLGRFKFLIREIKCVNFSENGSQNQSDLDITEEVQNIGKLDYLVKIKAKPMNDKEITCRICLSNEDTKENPLISPCVCSGSMSYVHITCLRHWLNSKSTSKLHGMGVIYNWKTFECEICRKPLPDVVLREKKPHFVVDPPKPESSYIMLETVGREKTSKICYLMLGIGQSNIKIGRGNDCDIRINDISVSRFHAFIRYSDGKFILEDNDSKFGTLVLINDKIILDHNISPSIQIGRTVINFSLNNKGHSPNSMMLTTGVSLQTEQLNSKEDEFDLNAEDKLIKFTISKKENNHEKSKNIFEEKANNKDLTNGPLLSSEDESSNIDKKMFNLQLDKDKTDYSHLQGFIDKSKYSKSSKINEDKTRERKNILNEMEQLSIGEEEDDDENQRVNLSFKEKKL